jgi:hypothetical protein
MSSKNRLLKPKGLSEKASVQWDRLAGELRESGVTLTATHRAPLTLAATLSADISDDWEEIKKEGTYSMGKNGIQIHPAAKRLDALRRDLLKVLAVLMRDVDKSKGEGPSLDDLLS